MDLILIGTFFVFLSIIVREVKYYRNGWGLNFHIFDLNDRNAWVKPFPEKREKVWLLITIIVELLLFSSLLVWWLLT